MASERRTSGATAASASGWRLEVLARRLERKTRLGTIQDDPGTSSFKEQ